MIPELAAQAEENRTRRSEAYQEQTDWELCSVPGVHDELENAEGLTDKLERKLVKENVESRNRKS